MKELLNAAHFANERAIDQRMDVGGELKLFRPGGIYYGGNMRCRGEVDEEADEILGTKDRSEARKGFHGG